MAIDAPPILGVTVQVSRQPYDLKEMGMAEKYRAVFMIVGMLIEAAILVFLFALIEPWLRKYLSKKIDEDLQ
jgi:hypothetical protein